MRALDSLMPKARHSQMISIGPVGGSGQVHHREMNEYGPPPPANGYNTRPAGSVSRSGLPPPRRPAACCRRKTAGRTGMSAGTPPDHAARRAGAAGVVGAGPDPRGQEDPDPVEKADNPVTATATWPVRASSKVAVWTMPGTSASGGSHE
jgi:hypothetical protein